MSTSMSTEYLTTAEVASLCRSPVETVRYWRYVGQGPKSFKVGRRVLYAAEDVEPPLRVDLPAEVLRVLPAGAVPVTRSPTTVRPLRDACHQPTDPLLPFGMISRWRAV
jgi:hypothetical protein